MPLETPRDIVTESCGCAAMPRRVCDVCHSPRHAFVACSGKCLERHLRAVHGAVPLDSEARARASQSNMSLKSPGTWDAYAHHRRMVMSHVPRKGGAICIFGAGNCADIDLEQLGAAFQAIHLVDIDGDALERARARQPRPVRDIIVPHGGIDLSGFLDRLDTWGERSPEDVELAQTAVGAAHRIVARLGGPFDFTLSTCVLSQLITPFRQSWAKSRLEWMKFASASTAVHLATLSGATRSGGAGFMAFDVLSSDHAPDITTFEGRPGEELQRFVAGQLEQGLLNLDPDPRHLLMQLKSPGLGSVFDAPEITLPWLWDICSAKQLVYGLSFRRT